MRLKAPPRRGFTLVELMVGLVLTLLVSGIAFQLLLGSQRATRRQSEYAGLQDNVRSAALVLAAELREVGYDAISPQASAALAGYPPAVRSDLLTIAPGSVTYRAARGLGFVCGVAPGEVTVDLSTWQAPRAPRVTDSLLLYVESDPATSEDDAWVHLGLSGTGARPCAGGRAGLAFRVAPPAGAPLDLATVLAQVTPGSPVRLSEVMELRYYGAEGKSWLGLRSVSAGELIQPVVGPLADSTATVRGLTFTGRDGANAATTAADQVRAVEVSLRGVTGAAVTGRDTRRGTVDTLDVTTRVALRNALRP